MEVNTDPDVSSPLILREWENAAWLHTDQFERLLIGTVGGTAGVGVVTLLQLHWPHIVLVVLIAVLSLAVLCGWIAVFRATTGRRRQLRKTFEVYHQSATRHEAFVAAATAYGLFDRNPSRHIHVTDLRDFVNTFDAIAEQKLSAVIGNRLVAHETMMRDGRNAIEQLCANFPQLHPDLSVLEVPEIRVLLSDLDDSYKRMVKNSHQLTGETTKLRDEAAVLEERVARLKDRATRLAKFDSPPVGHLLYPDQPPGTAPAWSQGRSVKSLQEFIANVERDAQHGYVIESAVAGPILKEKTRWSAHAVPTWMTRDLMELFGGSLPPNKERSSQSTDEPEEGAHHDSATEQRTEHGDEAEPITPPDPHDNGP